MKFTAKDMLMVLIALVGLGALVAMLNAEGYVQLTVNPMTAAPDAVVNQFQQQILPAIQRYSLMLGILLVALSAAYILLVGHQEDIATTMNEPDKK